MSVFFKLNVYHVNLLQEDLCLIILTKSRSSPLRLSESVIFDGNRLTRERENQQTGNITEKAKKGPNFVGKDF